MIDAFVDIKERVSQEISCEPHSEIKPLNADPWIVSSLLQKSIRRGETEIAQSAVHTLLAFRGSAIWLRLMLIAFEDIGVGDPDLVTTVVAVAMDGAWRKRAGGDAATAQFIARRMAECPKDRSADYLICGAKDHPEKEILRRKYEGLSHLREIARGRR